MWVMLMMSVDLESVAMDATDLGGFVRVVVGCGCRAHGIDLSDVRCRSGRRVPGMRSDWSLQLNLVASCLFFAARTIPQVGVRVLWFSFPSNVSRCGRLNSL